MKGPMGVALVGLACTVGLSVSSANAASGRIVFSGAVVEPTCLAAGSELTASPDHAGSAQHRFGCGTTGHTYTREVLDLAATHPNADRLLDYFASYALPAVGGMAAAKVIVHTYD